MNINKGSIETILVDVVDALETVGTLPDGTRFDLYRDDEAVSGHTSLVPTIVDLQARCVIDTSDLDEGTYELYLRFTAAPETPVLGPHRFRVV